MSKKVSSQRGTNPPTRDVNAATRVTLAVELRAQRLTYSEIAQRCGYGNASACRKAVMRELDRTIVTNVDALRTEELDSLDRLEVKVWERLADAGYEKSMLFAVDRILAIKERRARLLGLDVPVKAGDVAANMVVVREVPAGLLVDEVKPA